MLEEAQRQEVRAYEENNKAIRVAIEFCIYIDAIFFLFTDLISLFTDENLEHIFLENLQPFILSGKFRKYAMPEEILKKIIAHYKAREDFEMLEKVIMYLHITDPMINSELQHICQTKVLSSGLLYISTNIYQSEPHAECLNVLFALFNLFKMSKIDTSKKDIYQLCFTTDLPRERRKQTESSKLYLGYKLLWVLRQFLRGKKFPVGDFSEQKHHFYVFGVVKFITNQTILEYLLKIDAECFFATVSAIFTEH